MAGSPASSATSSVTLQRRSWWDRLWTKIADRGKEYASVPRTSLPPSERASQLASALLSERGEASGAAVARDLHNTVRELAPEQRIGFYKFVATGFLPDEARLRAAAEAYLAEPNAERAAHLAEAAEPPRQELLRRMNMSPGGTAALVAARKEILKRIRDEPALQPLDSDLHHLLASWFNRGFLQVRRIDWQTPAAVLEKIIQYEAVHEIQGWEDLRRRLAPDRRCFGFFHPALPGEPLIFVEVALTEGLAASVQPLLARDHDEAAQREREHQADTAIFYSISNCQDGLRGISFGNFLIKQVVEELQAELPRLVQFSTLSPIPGFRRWLEKRIAAKKEPDKPLLRPEEAAALHGEVPESAGLPEADLLSKSLEGEWWLNPELSHALRKPLVRLCATYLTAATQNGPSDPVARFHLGNGARLERINWLGNTAPRGIRESYGLMVNYLYDPEAIEANHEAFVRHGTVARSAAVDGILADANPPEQKAKPKSSGLLGRF